MAGRGERVGSLLAMVACLLLVLAGGCGGFRGERWQVRRLGVLGRGSVSVRAAGEGDQLTVWLTTASAPGEEVHVVDLHLTRSRGTVAGLASPLVLPPDEVRGSSGYGGSIGLGFVYSTGDVERYVSRHGGGGYYAPAGPAGPERLRASWTLTGPWARARELELVVVAAVATYPRGSARREKARFLLVRPEPTGERAPAVRPDAETGHRYD